MSLSKQRKPFFINSSGKFSCAAFHLTRDLRLTLNWSVGVLEYCRIPSLHHSTIPTLQFHSNTPILFPYPQLPLNVPYDVEVGDFRVRHRPLDLHCLPALIYHELQTAF